MFRSWSAARFASSLLVCSLLVCSLLVAAPASAQDNPPEAIAETPEELAQIEDNRLYYESLSAIRLNPIGLQERASLYYRRRLIDAPVDSVLFGDTWLGVGPTVMISPAFSRAGVDLRPYFALIGAQRRQGFEQAGADKRADSTVQMIAVKQRRATHIYNSRGHVGAVDRLNGQDIMQHRSLRVVVSAICADPISPGVARAEVRHDGVHVRILGVGCVRCVAW